MRRCSTNFADSSYGSCWTAETRDWTSTRRSLPGVLDSLSVNVLISFTNERFGIEVPQSEVAPQNLKDLDSYVALLMRLR